MKVLKVNKNQNLKFQKMANRHEKRKKFKVESNENSNKTKKKKRKIRESLKKAKKLRIYLRISESKGFFSNDAFDNN